MRKSVTLLGRRETIKLTFILYTRRELRVELGSRASRASDSSREVYGPRAPCTDAIGVIVRRESAVSLLELPRW